MNHLRECASFRLEVKFLRKFVVPGLSECVFGRKVRGEMTDFDFHERRDVNNYVDEILVSFFRLSVEFLMETREGFFGGEFEI